MDDYIRISSSFERIEEIIDISSKINILNNNLSKDIYSSFDFNEEYDDTIIFLKKNNLLKVKFYIKNKNFNKKDNIECPICYNYFNNNIFITSCKHIFCKSCYKKWENTCNFNIVKTTCPLCRKN
jgi:predicted nucleotidyltransferase component of viral defense system